MTSIKLIKIVSLLLVIGLNFSASSVAYTSEGQSAIQSRECGNLNRYSWILGEWQFLSDKKIMIESWKRIDGQNFVGIGRTEPRVQRTENNHNVSSDKESAWVESLRITEMSGQVFFIAKPPQNKLPTAFLLDYCDKNTLKFVNPQHDFPKVIEYHLNDKNNLVAKVSGDNNQGFQIEYKKQPEVNIVSLVEDYVAAYNQKDLTAMMLFASESIRWMSVSDGKIVTEAADKKSLEIAMKDYFSGSGSTQSTLVDTIVNGSFVSAIEKASWQSKGETKSRCSPVVYQIVSSKIENVWYYPAQKCD